MQRAALATKGVSPPHCAAAIPVPHPRPRLGGGGGRGWRGAGGGGGRGAGGGGRDLKLGGAPVGHGLPIRPGDDVVTTLPLVTAPVTGPHETSHDPLYRRVTTPRSTSHGPLFTQATSLPLHEPRSAFETSHMPFSPVTTLSLDSHTPSLEDEPPG